MILDAQTPQCFRAARLRFVLLLSLVCGLEGCAVGYYGQAVRGQVEIFSRRQPIQHLIQDPETDAALVQKLRRVQAARRFAVEELGLPDNGSYLAYADLERPFVVWNVVAADRFSVEPEQWCFVFVGCLSYRGFFREDKANAFADKLLAQGKDAYVGGVAAYSTLGVFKDPVLNTMLNRGERYVASTIFHELAHQLVYIKGDSAFNEAFATVVEEHATVHWLNWEQRDAEAEAYRGQLTRRDQFSELIEATRQRLRAIYAEGTEADKQARKREAFEELQQQYADLRLHWGGHGDYDRFFAQPLNNAHLAGVATYQKWVPGMRLKLGQGPGLASLVEWAEAMALLDPDSRREQLDQLRKRALDESAIVPPFGASRRVGRFGLAHEDSVAR
jgi:predicted aminopeptidase